MIDVQDGDVFRRMFSANKEYYEEYYEEYFDEDILQDIINVGFDDWDATSSVDIFDEYDEYDESDYFDFRKTTEDKKENEGLVIFKNNPHIYQLDRLLGNFRIYIENNIDAKTFATNNKYMVINLLHPYGIECVTNELYEISDLDLDVLMKYDFRIKNILDRFKNHIPNINIPSLGSLHNKYTPNDDEDIPF
ncbi:hypothetical protein [Proteiniborus sp.]|uniref:hypothetical protein n=1 Tax=Proteiniborus sp. TaxID=2079015 RepID=UPI00331BCB74